MILASLVLGGPAWLWPSALLAAVTLAVLLWSYRRATAPFGWRCSLALLKALGVVLLLACLIEPLFSGTRPRPGANLFVVLADDSQSLQIRDAGTSQTRVARLRAAIGKQTAWHVRLSQQFDVRRYRFDERLRPWDDEADEGLTAAGTASSLGASLQTISRRFQGQPLAGVLVFTDGNATDLPDEGVDWSRLPPVYAVPLGASTPAPDVSIANVAVSQTNFEQAPVTVRAEIAASGYDRRKLAVQLLDLGGTEIDQAVVEAEDRAAPRAVRFQFRPERSGTSFYQLRAIPESERAAFDSPSTSTEATLANNTRLVAVDRPAGPFRVLYVAGRANWEFKFLRRALETDREVELVSLIRIAKREPKFSFLSRDGESTNPLYRGFQSQDAEVAEQYDEPVLIRLGARDAAELRDGFPKTADVLYAYDAVILDDVEAAFFSQDQMLLLQKFVGVRGGGFLMLGGAESLFQGEYRRTPIGELLPVYLDRTPPPTGDVSYRLALTREGWLQPWVRLRETEDAERQRLDAMPAFQTLNRVRSIKPGAEVLANVTDGAGGLHPALAAQRFGKGQVGTLLIGDMWRWTLQRAEGQEDDLAKAWRQMIRWLVANVPGRIGLDVRRRQSTPGSPVEIAVQVRGSEYEPLDNAKVEVTVTAPGGKELQLHAESSDQQAGAYVAAYLPREPGAYRLKAAVSAADGSSVGEKETGWTAEPAADEFSRLTPNRDLLRSIAQQTGGEVVELDDLDRFVADLPNKKIPITEPWEYPLWHQPQVFLLALACLVAEWGLRRRKGLP